jgi:four helix bundle protein
VLRVQAYRLAVELIPIVKADAAKFRYKPGSRDLTSQLIRAAGSIAANVAEGYSRTSTADRRKFYEYALGSAREAEVWYSTLAPAVSQQFAPAISRLTSIRRLLLVMIRNTPADAKADRSKS